MALAAARVRAVVSVPRMRWLPRAGAAAGLRRSIADYGAPDDDATFRVWRPPPLVADPRSLSVALLGAPNAGKSMLLNRLVREKVSAESPKSHTTRTRLLGIVTEGSTQLVFSDTPGVLEDRSSGPSPVPAGLAMHALAALESADVGLLVLDMAKRFDEDDQAMMRDLVRGCKKGDTEPLLVLNKADLLTERSQRIAKHDAIVDAFEQVAFAEGLVGPDGLDAFPLPRVHMISALQGTGVPELRAVLQSMALPRPWDFDPSLSTDLSELERVREIVREKLFKNLHKDAPYLVRQETRSWKRLPSGELVIHQDLQVPTRGIVNMLTGRRGATLKAISRAAARDLEDVLRVKVHLYLHVAHKARLLERGVSGKAGPLILSP